MMRPPEGPGPSFPGPTSKTIPLAAVGPGALTRSVPGPVGDEPIQVVWLPSGATSPTRSGPDPDRTGTETEVTDKTVPKYWVRTRPATTGTVDAGATEYW
jgi:hypothetical protein